MTIPISRPSLGPEESRLVQETLASGWVTQGPRVAAFEEAFARRVGARFAVAVASGTAGLHLALVAAGVGPGDEVVVPTMTFIAGANAVLHAGATPVLCDVDGRTFNAGVAEIERALTPRTRAVLCVHQIGLPCDLDEIAALCRARGLLLVEDAACAVGSELRGRRVGAPAGVAAVFSFHPRKILTTGEGGMITTDDEALNERLRRLRQHGARASAHERHAAAVPVEEYPELGWNYRMSDVHAAIGLGQLGRLDELLARRRAQAERYAERLAGTSVTAPSCPSDRVHAWQSYQVLLDGQRDRDDVIASMAGRGVSVRRAVMVCHAHGSYRTQGPFPVADEVSRRGLLLPLFHDLTADQQDEVVAALVAALEERRS